ncbi:Crp/Fnr family transcriptional regulator [Schinkia azotoformans]|uniref:Crp/Fnr family transcriptional regulator n=1 Tax=Schinkia azotoformans TaxID=1454 RepID=UPI002DB8D021|nr:Crp/Fnr family transcriptional regulator [Schinkia azotoformans]MEC1720837.1 Crp/Fnr family transcriptional regulator [Schinkia azotoformans]MED4412088.1 Crp/Fnr family transcriptional regulator [Schinkia azotoformans]
MSFLKDSIKNFPIIKELDENALTHLLNIIRLRQYKNHGQIFSKGTSLNEIYFIIRGKVKIFNKDSCGKEQIVWIMQKGDIFPLEGFSREVTFPANAEALEDSIIGSIGVHDFESLILDNPNVLIKLFSVMNERIIDLQTRLEEQVLLERNMQIVKLLLRLCERYGEITQNGQCHLKPQFTTTDLAKMVGASRGSISRTYTRLIKEQLLYKDNVGGLLVEFEKLKEKFG